MSNNQARLSGRFLSFRFVSRYLFLIFPLIVSHTSQRAEASDARTELPVQRIARIPAGTEVWNGAKQGYSNVILFVKGKLAAGDLNSVSDSMNYYGELFNLVYMANIKSEAGKKPVLDRIAVGFSTKIKGKDIVITADTANQIGAGLNFIGRNVLSGNEEALNAITITAKTPTVAVVDAPAVVQFQNKHQLMVARFVIWVSPDGKLGTVVWLLQKTRNQYEFAEKVFQFLPPSMIENRVMHVDGSQITLGIPSASAFAIVSIPQGTPIQVTDQLRQAGAAPRFSTESLNQLVASLAGALKQKR